VPVLIYFILLADALLGRKPVRRAPDAQARVDAETASLRLYQFELYQFEACPYCRKVSRDMRLLGLHIESPNIKRDPMARGELIAGGGKKQVPCLRIEEAGKVRWLYESRDITGYLRARFE
jgi:glutaredoxin